MAEYLGPATDNEAEVIAGMVGHKTPDRYGTDDQEKFGNAHPKRIHNDLSRYTGDTPEGWVT